MFQSFVNSPILDKSTKEIPPTAVEIFLKSIFDLEQTWKIVPTEKFSATHFVYISFKGLEGFKVAKNLKELRFEGDWDKL